MGELQSVEARSGRGPHGQNNAHKGGPSPGGRYSLRLCLSPCHACHLFCLVSSCLVLSCLVLSCLVLSCLVLSCLVIFSRVCATYSTDT